MARPGRASRGKHQQPSKSAAPAERPRHRTRRFITQGLAILAIAALVAAIILTSQPPDDIGSRTHDTGHASPQLVEVAFKGDRSTWQLLALSDEELEKVSLVELNLAVVREIPGYEDIDIAKYERIIDEWTKQFAAELPKIDATFVGQEDKFNNDIRFYRFGQLMALTPS